MRFEDRFQHAILVHFAGKALDHQHGVEAAGDNQIEIAFFQFVLGGERHELAVDMSQPHRADGSLERQRRDRQRGAGADHRQHVGIVLPIARKRGGLNLHFVAEPFRKQRPNRAVHEPRGERFFSGGATFAFDEAPRKLAGRGSPLAIIASQRKEVAAADSWRTEGHGGEHRGVAVGH